MPEDNRFDKFSIYQQDTFQDQREEEEARTQETRESISQQLEERRELKISSDLDWWERGTGRY